MIFLSVAIFDATSPTKKAVWSVVPHIVVPILGIIPVSALSFSEHIQLIGFAS